ILRGNAGLAVGPARLRTGRRDPRTDRRRPTLRLVHDHHDAHPRRSGLLRKGRRWPVCRRRTYHARRRITDQYRRRRVIVEPAWTARHLHDDRKRPPDPRRGTGSAGARCRPCPMSWLGRLSIHRGNFDFRELTMTSAQSDYNKHLPTIDGLTEPFWQAAKDR